MKKFVLAIMITAGTMGSAQAWGDREQGALAGLIVGAIAQRAFSQPQQTGYPPVQQGQQYPTQQYPTQQYPVYIPQPQIIVQAPPVIYQPQPIKEQCYTFQERDIYGRFHGHRTVCRMVPGY
jgi:hypothetical protein